MAKANDDYIVRIYRRGRHDPRLLVGTVERVGAPGRKAFGTLDELCSILLPPARSIMPAPSRPRMRSRQGS